MANPLVVLHGWSDNYESFRNLAVHLRDSLSREVVHINLVDWLSLDDAVTFLDLRFALQRAWLEKGLPTTHRSVDIVVHSTGSPVVRDWMTTYYKPDTVPIQRMLMLAPANYGSPLAHKGRAFYGRILKGWKTGLQTGTHLLKGLELASPYSYDLACRDILDRAHPWYGSGRILATVLVGNQGYRGVRAAANEDGSDGTVRVCTANLNAAELTLDASGEAGTTPQVTTVPAAQQAAFGVVNNENHGSITLAVTPHNRGTKSLITRALQVEDSSWDSWRAELQELTQAQIDAAKPRGDTSRHCFQNTVVRVRDSLGNSVPEYFVAFAEKDSDADTSLLGCFFHEKVLRNVHAYCDDSSWKALYIDTTLLYARIDKQQESLDVRVDAHPDVDTPAGSRQVGYLPDAVMFSLSSEQVRKVFVPDRTLFVNLTLKRFVGEDVVRIIPGNPDARGKAIWTI